MKRYIKSAYEPTFKGTWSEEDIELWKSIDWKARNYEEYPVEGTETASTVYIYGLGEYGIGHDYVTMSGNMIKYLRPNSIFPPYYAPDPAFAARIDAKYGKYGIVGPMYDGRSFDGYSVHNRYETQEVYDALTR